ncbi:RidA family protein [Thioalkalivibrio sp. HK1]|uniref:RidA family protein n=1 Tax=Thioalkalivibrio sp. HK1 TaxID=1469245 RepID=UPI0004723F11|nr:RidA family protein [Thioalkalivibrio sp. HK1]
MNDPLFLMVPGAPRPVAPYSHAVESAGFIFLTGQLPNDPEDDHRPFPQGIEAQTLRVMNNLRIVLYGVGSRLEDVVSIRVFLTHFDRDYAKMNEIYRTFFPPDRLPARTCIGVSGLARQGLVEIDAIARRLKD